MSLLHVLLTALLLGAVLGLKTGSSLRDGGGGGGGGDGVPLFTHIPKNGGSFVEMQLRMHGLTSFKPAGCRVPCSPQHVPVGLAIEDGCHKHQEGQEMFAVLRHPYQRAVSQWTWGRDWTWKLGYDWTAADMNRFIQDSVSNASVAEDSAACRAPGGDGFRPETWCGRFLQDCHWLPQSDYIYSSDYSKWLVTLLLHQSNLTSEVRALLGSIIDRPPEGLPVPDARAAMRAEDAVSEDELASWACSLTEETRRALDRHYAKDFELFGHLFDKTNFVKKPCGSTMTFDKSAGHELQQD